MKKNHFKYILVLYLFVSVSTFAQTSEVGISSGYGKSDIGENAEVFLLPYDKTGLRLNFFTAGLSYHFTPKKAFFLFNTGLNYIKKWDDGLSFNYLRVPLGIDFQLGKEVQFIAGGGFYASYLLPYSGVSSEDFENSKQVFQLGAFLNAGIGLQLTERYHLSLFYQTSFDGTELYSEQNASSGGAPYETDIVGYDGFLMLRLKYRFGEE
jgi:hypothetical protein